MVLTQFPGLAFGLVAIGMLDYISRKSCILLGFLVIISSYVSTVMAASSKPPRTWFMEAAYQYGMAGGPNGTSLCLLALYQVAVEIFPPTSSATGGALII